jgi:GNAT superfamily N-acetyltransferase
MPIEENITIREANKQEDSLIVEHFYKLFIDVGVPEDAIASNWEESIYQFIANARQNLSYRGFIAEFDGAIVGSVSCQLFVGLYPNIFKPHYRLFGYIWGVYVEPSYRRKGIAKQLTNTCVDYLKTIGCTRVVLNASPLGQLVYENIGFVASNAMHIDIFEKTITNS